MLQKKSFAATHNKYATLFSHFCTEEFMGNSKSCHMIQVYRNDRVKDKAAAVI